MGNSIIKILLTGDESFMDAIRKNEYRISVQTIHNICKAVHDNLKSIDIAKIETPHHNITLKSTEEHYKEALELNKNIMIKYEEYELCSKANKALEVLAKKNLVVNTAPGCI